MKIELKKMLIKSLIPFIIVQLIMLSTAIFFAGGGHGTGIPLIIFYGPLLLFLKFEIFGNNPALAFIILFLILSWLFIAVWRGSISKKVLMYVMVFYVLISAIILIYTEVNNLGLGSSRVPLNIKIIAGLIAVIISTAFWRIIFGLVNHHIDFKK